MTDNVLDQLAARRLAAAKDRAAKLDDFFAYLPQHKYVFRPTGDLWPAGSVNGAVDWPTNHQGKPVRPSAWLDRHQPVQQMTWTPAEPEIIDNRLVAEGGWIAKPGSRTYNLYRPPSITRGDKTKAQPWRDHLRTGYPDDADQIERWFAQRVQFPGVKLNHALVLGGAQAIGKDTLLEPVKAAVGAWNWSEISPTQMMGRFNGWIKSVVLRVNEARDLGETDRFTFYDHAKTYVAPEFDTPRPISVLFSF